MQGESRMLGNSHVRFGEGVVILQSNGDNCLLSLTSRHRGGGHKRLYRHIDFRRDKFNTYGKIVSIEYDPYRNAHIALLHYQDGQKRYILYPRGLQLGSSIISAIDAPILVGNALPLSRMPLGAEIHNIESFPGSGGQFVRSAGTVAQLVAKEGNFVAIRLPSKEMRLIPNVCWATLGQVGNVDAMNLTLGKAGRQRWIGKRPKVSWGSNESCRSSTWGWRRAYSYWSTTSSLSLGTTCSWTTNSET